MNISMSENDALRLLGWIDAHRPPGDWEPGFLSRVMRSVEHSIKEASDDVDHG